MGFILAFGLISVQIAGPKEAIWRGGQILGSTRGVELMSCPLHGPKGSLKPGTWTVYSPCLYELASFSVIKPCCFLEH